MVRRSLSPALPVSRRQQRDGSGGQSLPESANQARQAVSARTGAYRLDAERAREAAPGLAARAAPIALKFAIAICERPSGTATRPRVRQTGVARAQGATDAASWVTQRDAAAPGGEHNSCMQANPRLQALAVLVGEWTTVGVHPMLPDKTFHSDDAEIAGTGASSSSVSTRARRADCRPSLR